MDTLSSALARVSLLCCEDGAPFRLWQAWTWVFHRL